MYMLICIFVDVFSYLYSFKEKKDFTTNALLKNLVMILCYFFFFPNWMSVASARSMWAWWAWVMFIFLFFLSILIIFSCGDCSAGSNNSSKCIYFCMQRLKCLHIDKCKARVILFYFPNINTFLNLLKFSWTN